MHIHTVFCITVYGVLLLSRELDKHEECILIHIYSYIFPGN